MPSMRTQSARTVLAACVMVSPNPTVALQSRRVVLPEPYYADTIWKTARRGPGRQVAAAIRKRSGASRVVLMDGTRSGAGVGGG